MHRLDYLAPLCASVNVGLIRDHDQQKARGIELLTTRGQVFVDFEVLYAGRGIGPALTHERSVEYAVAIEENSATRYFVLSHFVCATLSFGWLTKRCQTTAWNASE